MCFDLLSYPLLTRATLTQGITPLAHCAGLGVKIGQLSFPNPPPTPITTPLTPAGLDAKIGQLSFQGSKDDRQDEDEDLLEADKRKEQERLRELGIERQKRDEVGKCACVLILL